MSMELFGKVIKGRGMGSKLGFPTVNIEYGGTRRGVFGGRVFYNGVCYKCAINIGGRPTLVDDSVCIEAHLLGFKGSIPLGTLLTVEVLFRIRNIRHFNSMDELKEQIARDVDFVKNRV